MNGLRARDWDCHDHAALALVLALLGVGRVDARCPRKAYDGHVPPVHDRYREDGARVPSIGSPICC
jgi:hypothetical protein